MAEIVTNLANVILSCKKWDHTTIHSPHASKIPAVKRLPEIKPCMPALLAGANVNPYTFGMVDGYIDNLVPVVLDIKANTARGAQAAPLAMHTIDRPVVEEEPLVRDDLLSFKKL